MKFAIFGFATVITQIGGIAYLLGILLSSSIKNKIIGNTFVLSLIIYSILTYAAVPLLAPQYGRVPITNSEKISAVNPLYKFLNRSYVTPELNQLLSATAKNISKINPSVKIKYMDANFPFINEFPLLPHLSHNDGKKIDISLVFATPEGNITTKQKSNSGYGVFAAPLPDEENQVDKCLGAGYFQYDYPKYLTFGKKNLALQFSEIGTKLLMQEFLKSEAIDMMFIEPHLKTRLKLDDRRIRYHGCKAVRHDDHIHIQIK